MSHDRTLDHFGTEDTTTAVLASDIGRYPTGMSLQDVLADMVGRITNLEHGCATGQVFTANAFIAQYLIADAVVKKTQVLDPFDVPFGFFANASIGVGTFTFTLTSDTVIRSVASSGTQAFVADAVLIDDVVCE